MYEGGYVTQVKCEDCSRSFPVFTFSADTDMVTNGCIALTGREHQDIVLTMMRPSESPEDVNRRIGLGYKVVEVEYKPAKNKTTSGFQDFLKSYQPPRVMYKCIYCEGTGAAIKEESKAEFMTHGTIQVRDAL
jgi:hypothetical protein